MMKRVCGWLLLLLSWMLLVDVVHGWAPPQQSSRSTDRRSFFKDVAIRSGVAAAAVVVTTPKQAAWAMASVSVSEFDVLLRDASKSIRIVELSGPKSETVIVTLVDGTQFRIADVVESATDPRSPLKVVASCRSYGVPTSFPDLKTTLATGGTTKRKLYRNSQVQKAAELEEEKRKRMQQDEQERLKQLFELQSTQSTPIDTTTEQP